MMMVRILVLVCDVIAFAIVIGRRRRSSSALSRSIRRSVDRARRARNRGAPLYIARSAPSKLLIYQAEQQANGSHPIAQQTHKRNIRTISHSLSLSVSHSISLISENATLKRVCLKLFFYKRDNVAAQPDTEHRVQNNNNNQKTPTNQ